MTKIKKKYHSIMSHLQDATIYYTDYTIFYLFKGRVYKIINKKFKFYTKISKTKSTLKIKGLFYLIL